jgi:hypothetical protein
MKQSGDMKPRINNRKEQSSGEANSRLECSPKVHCRPHKCSPLDAIHTPDLCDFDFQILPTEWESCGTVLNSRAVRS